MIHRGSISLLSLAALAFVATGGTALRPFTARSDR